MAEDDDSSTGLYVFGTIINIAVILFAGFAIGFQCGEQQAKKELQTQAVTAGVGKWEVDQKGTPSFHFANTQQGK